MGRGGGVGRRAVRHSLIITGLGDSHAAGASLASVLKEGKEEIPTREAAAEADSIFFHQFKRPSGSWKRGQ